VSTTSGERGCTADDYRSAVDREAIARRQRRRQVAEALDEERGREAALVERLEEIVVEGEGARIDEQIFEQMQPDDVALVREVLEATSFFGEDDDPELQGFDAEDHEQDDLDEEISRLEGEIADSRRKQLAFERYLEALEA
jgi:hypothetical protein